MFHHYKTISQIPEVFQCLQELVIILLMETNTRFIQYICHTDQARADLGRQTDSLRLTAGQSASRTGQHKIVQTHINEKTQTRTNFLQNLLPDHLLMFAQRQMVHEIQKLDNGHFRNFGNVFIRNCNCQ